MKNIENQGLILYSQNYKEKDKLVKIFTKDYGKRMFFVKNAHRSRFNGALQPFTSANMILQINDNGFSFITDVNQISMSTKISEDIFLNAYSSYIIALADAAISDNTKDPVLFNFLKRALELINDGFDPQIITNIFELQIMSRFGAQLDFSQCVFCHRKDLPMDFSFKYNACLCPSHYNEDFRRSHLDPNVVYFANLFMNVDLDKIEAISLKDDMKEKIRKFIDELYEEYIGIHLKPKKFLDEMNTWADLMKNKKND